MQYEIRSPLDPETCVRRIEDQLRKNTLSNRDRRPLWGKVQEQSLSVRLASGMRNPFAPYFRGRFEPMENGTLLCGECQLSSGLKTVAVAWALLWILLPCALTAFVEVGLIALLLTYGEQLRLLGDETYHTLLSMPIMILPFPVMFAIIGTAFPVLFIGLRRGDCEKIAGLLEATLDGKGKCFPAQTINGPKTIPNV